jgi:NAD(P)H-nitrite reductase large subunit
MHRLTLATVAELDCPSKVVCHCLGVTEEALIEAITSLGLETLQQVRHCTGAGDGCTSCHAAIRQYLERYSPSSSSALPICSVR